MGMLFVFGFNIDDYLHISKCVFFITQVLQLVGMLIPVNRINITSCVAVAISTDRPKYIVRNPCVIDIYCGVLFCHFSFLMFYLYGGFFIWLSWISSFFSHDSKNNASNAMSNKMMKI